MKKIAFTIVLNGMPFIKRQAEIIPKIFDEWHIVEGATLPVKDTQWCKSITSDFFSDKKLSIDNTTEFIDSIADNKQIFVHRKNDFWHGKTEMCQQIEPYMQNCILMQFDVDEIWKEEILKDVVLYAIKNEGFDGMLFKCRYYVGQNLLIQNENCYGNYSTEWSRLWKISKNAKWVSHEPPHIKGCNKFLSQAFTSQKGWVFDHYAYVNEEQVRFKEVFYGYNGAVSQWKLLQQHNNFPCTLKQFLPWVDHLAIVDKL